MDVHALTIRVEEMDDITERGARVRRFTDGGAAIEFYPDGAEPIGYTETPKVHEIRMSRPLWKELAETGESGYSRQDIPFSLGIRVEGLTRR